MNWCFPFSCQDGTNQQSGYVGHWLSLCEQQSGEIITAYPQPLDCNRNCHSDHHASDTFQEHNSFPLLYQLAPSQTVHLEDPNLHQSFGNISTTNNSHSSQTRVEFKSKAYDWKYAGIHILYQTLWTFESLQHGSSQVQGERFSLNHRNTTTLIRTTHGEF
jgi:hypothetical protein